MDSPERADLLCFLVLAQLIAHANTGEWLRTDHVVKAGQIWAASNATDCDWIERAKLARHAGCLRGALGSAPMKNPAEGLGGRRGRCRPMAYYSATDSSWLALEIPLGTRRRSERL